MSSATSLALGAHIVKIYSTLTTLNEGIDMPGITGDQWEYEDLILELSNLRFLRLNPGKFEVIDELPTGSVEIEALNPHNLDFKEFSITDCFDDGEGGYYLALAKSFYLEHSYQPGGSSISIGEFAKWSDPQDFEDLKSLFA